VRFSHGAEVQEGRTSHTKTSAKVHGDAMDRGPCVHWCEGPETPSNAPAATIKEAAKLPDYLPEQG
jgi:hypothetical protein